MAIDNSKQEFIDLAWDLVNVDFASISQQIIHRTSTMESYDTIDGGINKSNNDVVVVGLLDIFRDTKFNGQDVLVGDVFMILPLKGLTKGVNTQTDIFITPDGNKYNIIQVVRDAADAAYEMQIRLRHNAKNAQKGI